MCSGGPFGGPGGPPTQPWRYWTAKSRPFEDLATETSLPLVNEAPSPPPAIVQPPMRGGRRRSGKQQRQYPFTHL